MGTWPFFMYQVTIPTSTTNVGIGIDIDQKHSPRNQQQLDIVAGLDTSQKSFFKKSTTTRLHNDKVRLYFYKILSFPQLLASP